ncbi:MAG: M16 family metallopeptidase [Armatimonadota bacterium]
MTKAANLRYDVTSNVTYGERVSLFHAIENIRSTRLPNGALLLTEEMPGVETVALGVWADAGSVDEQPDEFGQAHLLEHMLFKGTGARTAYQLAETIEDVGGQINAFTERETTHLYARVLAEHLHIALDLMSDMVCNSTFPPDELQREIQVVAEEILKYESLPEERIHDLIMESLWQGGGLGHPILGTEETIRHLTRENVIGCWRRHFAAERVIITVAGKISHETAFEMVAPAFENLPARTAVLPILPAGTRVPRMIIEEDDEQVHFCWGGRSYPARDDKNFPLAVVDAILGASSTSRLFQEIREKRGLAYDIGSYSMGFRETGLICATSSTSADTFPQVIELVQQEVNALRNKGISSDELRRAKEQMKASLALCMEGTVDRMRRLATHQLTWGTIIPLATLIDRFNRVTMDEVMQVMEETLNLDRWSFTAIGVVDVAQLDGIIGAE